MIITIDPGIRGCGVAGVHAGCLAWAAYVENPCRRVGHGPRECAWMARAVVTEVEGRFSKCGLGRVVLEWPQVYRTGRGKGDPNDLLALAGVDSAIAALLLHRLGLVSVDYVLPRAWKGTLDGDVLVRRIQERVTPEEYTRVRLPSAASLHHNVWDAVGLALWSVGRMAKRRVVNRS